MAFGNDLAKVIHNPSLLRKAPGVMLSRYAYFVVGKQVRSRASSLEASDLSPTHYGWHEITGQFAWDIFCIQQTNLINFVKNFTAESYPVVAEIGATSDMFLRHIKAERKIGINVLDVCVEQLNRQGITGMKTDGQRMPLADGEADLVICFETLEHVPDPLLFLAELGRITKKTLLLSLPWVTGTNVRAKWHGMADPGGRPDSEFHIFEFDERDFRKVISYTNFKISGYQKLINYEARYDPFTNWCLRRHMFLDFFPAIQGYVLEKHG